MTIYLGADHGGYQLKETIKAWLTHQKYQVEDCGANQLDPSDDYPQYAFTVARKVAAHQQTLGILFCRSGAGMTIAANKIKGIRAVEVFNELSAQHAKQHNNANIISLSADWLDEAQAKAIIQKFLTTEFTNEKRHIRRIGQIQAQESKHLKE